MIILNKKTRRSASGIEVSIRTLGHDFWIPLSEAKHYVKTGQAFFKVNKPVSNSDLTSLVGA